MRPSGAGIKAQSERAEKSVHRTACILLPDDLSRSFPLEKVSNLSPQDPSDTPSSHLHHFANPQSIALVGASTNPLKWGHRILSNVIDGAYEGRLYPVNPKETEILGLKAYPSVAALPEVPDVVLVCVPAFAAAEALEEAARAGVRAVAVITAGFAETGNQEAEARLAEVARRWGLAMVGPNSMGFFSARAKARPMMASPRPAHGGVAFLSQSGNVGSQGLGRGHLHGTGFTLFFSVGNAATLDWADYLDFLTEDEQTRVIALYLEGAHDGEGLLRSLARAVETKPVVLTKGGRTSAGSRAAQSHTAALATPETLFEGLIRQSGAIQAHSIEEMMDVATALDCAPLPKGSRVGIITWGGGWGVLATDACVAAGLEVPSLSPETVAAIDKYLPSYWSKDNPVDLVGGLDHAAHLEVLNILSRDPGFDAILVLGLLSSEDPYLEGHTDLGLMVYRQLGVETAERAIELAKETGKLIIGVSMGGVAPPPEAIGRLPVYHTPDRAVLVLARMAEHARARARMAEPDIEIDVNRARAAEVLAAAPSGSTLSERESLELLDAYGISTVGWELCSTSAQAGDAAERLGFPVVVKACGRGIAHKTERGLVVAGIRNAEELKIAWETLQERLGGDEAEGILVQSMLSSAREFTLGLLRDPVFGPCVMFGQGGIFAEAARDVSFRTAHLTIADAREMISKTRASALLGPLRGEPAVDAEALAGMLVRLGRLGVDFPQIAEIDVNPVLVPAGSPSAVDALVVTR